MNVKKNNFETEATQNEKGHWTVGNILVSVDGVNFVGGYQRAYTYDEIMAMTVAELDAVEASIENIVGFSTMLKADKQQALLYALGILTVEDGE